MVRSRTLIHRQWIHLSLGGDKNLVANRREYVFGVVLLGVYIDLTAPPLPDARS